MHTHMHKHTHTRIKVYTRMHTSGRLSRRGVWGLEEEGRRYCIHKIEFTAEEEEEKR